MPSTNDSQPPRGRRPHHHLYLLPTATPLPAVVPLLRPDLPVTPAQDALLTGLARRARLGDRAARDLLWRAFAPKLEPAVRRCRRMAWGGGWTRRDGRPWELDDLRQEAWLVFGELAEGWNGEGSFVPYVMAFFPWRLRNAMRRLGPGRGRVVPGRGGAPRENGELLDAEVALLLAQVAAALEPADARLLDLHLCQGIALSEIAARSGLSRRTISRRWEHVRRVAQRILGGRSRFSREWQ